jgi:phytoene desaturase
MPDPKQVVVIGAGPGGLASAILLAGAGYRVKVLERHDRIGGRTSAIVEEGYRFDVGPTFFLYPRVLESIFAAVGRNLRDYVELVRLDPQYHLVFGAGGELEATPDVASMQREIAVLSPHDAAQFPRFMAENRLKMDRFRPILESPFLGWRDLVSRKMASALPMLRPWLSLDGELRRYFRDPRVRLALTFQSKYLGMSPFQCPSLFSILSFIEYEYGVYHPMGGCAAVTRAMATVARELGAQISVGDPVEEILFDGRRAVGVRSRSGTHRADALVINADFARAMTSLVPDRLRRRWNDRALERKRFSCSTFMLYLGIEGRYDQLAHHTIYLAQDYLRNLADIESRHVLSLDPSFYVQNAGVTDGTLAPSGHSTLYVLVPVTHQHKNVDWSKEHPRFRELALGQLAKIGLEDVRSRIRFERMITPDDWDQGYQIHLGATFNLAHNLSQMLHLRPRNRFDDLDSVYLVGGGTHPGSGLPVIFESAKITAKLVAEDLGMSQTILPGATSPPFGVEMIADPSSVTSGSPYNDMSEVA